MEHSIGKIHSKPSDYILCPICNNTNWYENSYCINCNSLIVYQDTMNEEEMEIWYREEIAYYLEEGYTEEECDEIFKDI